MAFLAVNNFFLGGGFKNTEQDNICVFIVFKAESGPKHKEKKILFGVFLKTSSATSVGTFVFPFN